MIKQRVLVLVTGVHVFASLTYAEIQTTRTPTRGPCTQSLLAMMMGAPSASASASRIRNTLSDPQALNAPGFDKRSKKQQQRAGVLGAFRDRALRGLLVQSIMADMQHRSDYLAARLAAAKQSGKLDAEAQLFDLVVIGGGPHDTVAQLAIVEKAQGLKTLTTEASDSVARTFLSNAFRVNSSNGTDKVGEVALPRRGRNLNPYPNGRVQTSDATAAKFVVASLFAETALVNRSFSDAPMLFGHSVVKVEDRELSPNASSFPLRYKLTYGNGSVVYSRGIIHATGISKEANLEKFDPQSRDLVKSEIAEAKKRGEAPRIETVGGVFAESHENPNHVRDHNIDKDGKSVDVIVIGDGDSANTYIEQQLGLAPEEGYGNYTASQGRFGKIFWFGQSLDTCEAFLNGIRTRYVDILPAIKAEDVLPIAAPAVSIEKLADGRYRVTAADGRSQIANRIVLATGGVDTTHEIYEPIIQAQRRGIQFDRENPFIASSAVQPITGLIAERGKVVIGRQLANPPDARDGVPEQLIQFHGPSGGKQAAEGEAFGITQNNVAFYITGVRTEEGTYQLVDKLAATKGQDSIPALPPLPKRPLRTTTVASDKTITLTPEAKSRRKRAPEDLDQQFLLGRLTALFQEFDLKGKDSLTLELTRLPDGKFSIKLEPAINEADQLQFAASIQRDAYLMRVITGQIGEDAKSNNRLFFKLVLFPPPVTAGGATLETPKAIVDVEKTKLEIQRARGVTAPKAVAAAPLKPTYPGPETGGKQLVAKTNYDTDRSKPTAQPKSEPKNQSKPSGELLALATTTYDTLLNELGGRLTKATLQRMIDDKTPFTVPEQAGAEQETITKQLINLQRLLSDRGVQGPETDKLFLAQLAERIKRLPTPPADNRPAIEKLVRGFTLGGEKTLTAFLRSDAEKDFKIQVVRGLPKDSPKFTRELEAFLAEPLLDPSLRLELKAQIFDRASSEYVKNRRTQGFSPATAPDSFVAITSPDLNQRTYARRTLTGRPEALKTALESPGLPAEEKVQWIRNMGTDPNPEVGKILLEISQANELLRKFSQASGISRKSNIIDRAVATALAERNLSAAADPAKATAEKTSKDGKSTKPGASNPLEPFTPGPADSIDAARQQRMSAVLTPLAKREQDLRDQVTFGYAQRSPEETSALTTQLGEINLVGTFLTERAKGVAGKPSEAQRAAVESRIEFLGKEVIRLNGTFLTSQLARDLDAAKAELDLLNTELAATTVGDPAAGPKVAVADPADSLQQRISAVLGPLKEKAFELEEQRKLAAAQGQGALTTALTKQLDELSTVRNFLRRRATGSYEATPNETQQSAIRARIASLENEQKAAEQSLASRGPVTGPSIAKQTTIRDRAKAELDVLREELAAATATTTTAAEPAGFLQAVSALADRIKEGAESLVDRVVISAGFVPNSLTEAAPVVVPAVSSLDLAKQRQIEDTLTRLQYEIGSADIRTDSPGELAEYRLRRERFEPVISYLRARAAGLPATLSAEARAEVNRRIDFLRSDVRRLDGNLRLRELRDGQEDFERTKRDRDAAQSELDLLTKELAAAVVGVVPVPAQAPVVQAPVAPSEAKQRRIGDSISRLQYELDREAGSPQELTRRLTDLNPVISFLRQRSAGLPATLSAEGRAAVNRRIDFLRYDVRRLNGNLLSGDLRDGREYFETTERDRDAAQSELDLLTEELAGVLP